MLEVMSKKCTNLKQEINKEENKEIISSNQIGLSPNFDASKRARLEYFPTAKKPLQVFVKTHPNDESLIIKDGYQWRKYGQKVTKDNASPRAYFRCSMAPNCPAKKKVQKCLHDKSIIVATYDGEHNHGVSDEPFKPSSSTLNDREAINTRLCEDVVQSFGYEKNVKFDEYVNSLIQAPNFTAVLIKVVAKTIIGQQHKRQDLNLNLNLSEE
ncbi:hypothetical protein RYX36_022419 [Vicia faba]